MEIRIIGKGTVKIDPGTKLVDRAALTADGGNLTVLFAKGTVIEQAWIDGGKYTVTFGEEEPGTFVPISAVTLHGPGGGGGRIRSGEQ